MPALKAVFRGVCADIAAGLLHGRAHRLEALDVLVDGADAEIAAAGHGNTRMTETAKLHADEIARGTDAADKLDRSRGVVRMAAVDLKGIARQTFDLRAHFTEDLKQKPNVRDIGDILYAADSVDQQRGGQDRDRRILSAGNGDGAAQTAAALYMILNQNKNPLYVKSICDLREFTQTNHALAG